MGALFNSPWRKPAIQPGMVKAQPIAGRVSKTRFPPAPALAGRRRFELNSVSFQNLKASIDIIDFEVKKRSVVSRALAQMQR